MAGHFHLPPQAADAAFGVDDRGRPFDPHVFAPIHDLLFPHTIGLEDRAALVGGERQRQAVLALELIVTLDAIGRDADQRGAGRGEARREPVEVERFGGAAGRIVLGVEEQNDELAAQVLEPNAAAGVGWQVEIRRQVANVQIWGHFVLV